MWIEVLEAQGAITVQSFDFLRQEIRGLALELHLLRVKGLGLRVQNLGFRDQPSGNKGLGFRVWDLQA